MPEGPEVRLLAEKLSRKLTNLYIQDFKVLGGRYKTHNFPKNMELFISLLPLKVKSINAYGKFMWWEFYDTDLTMWNTLGMSGWWQSKDEPHNNIAIVYSQNKKDKTFKKYYFNDYRNFGTFIFDTKANLDKKLKTFGPNIFNTDKTSQDRFLNLVKKSQVIIAEILMNQKIATGCGNYLRAEALYLAGINPFTIGKNLDDITLKELWNVLNQLAWNYYDREEGIRRKIINKNYRLADDFDRIFLVYSQKIDPLGNKIFKQKIKDRTIHYVPQIQTI